jgi:predicted O-methyltransferase YrrM
MKAIQLTPQLHAYLMAHNPRVSRVLDELAAETSKMPRSQMQIAPDQGALMFMLAKLVAAKRVVELGCFTGYSAICMASALPQGGKLVTLDVDAETTKVAKRYFAAAGLDDKIELRLGPGLDSLAALKKEWGLGSVDLVFIDADKGNMVRYYEQALELLRPGGLVVGDNVLWGGSVADPSDQDDDTKAIRAFNEHVLKDTRVDKSLVNVADGLFLARKH